MFRKTLRAASAAADTHSLSSVASPPNGKLSPLFKRPPKPTPLKSKKSRSLLAKAENSHDEPTIGDLKTRLQKFLQTNCKSGDVSADEAFRFFHSMVQMEPRFPLYSFNLLLKGLAKKKRYSDVLSLYGKMNSAGLTPNFISLNILLHCLCNANRVCDAFLVMGRILRMGYSPTVRTFNSLIKGFCIGSRVYDAVRLFSKLQKFGCRPNLIICNALKRELDMAGGNDVNDRCDNENDSLCKERNEDKAMELSNTDTPIGDINNSRPDSWLMLVGNVLAGNIKGQEELKSSMHRKYSCLPWKTLHEQLMEEILSTQRSTQS